MKTAPCYQASAGGDLRRDGRRGDGRRPRRVSVDPCDGEPADCVATRPDLHRKATLRTAERVRFWQRGASEEVRGLWALAAARVMSGIGDLRIPPFFASFAAALCDLCN